MSPTLLGWLRMKGVVLALDGGDLLVSGLAGPYLPIIRSHKPSLVDRLRLEALIGAPLWEDTAFGAGLTILLMRLSEAYEWKTAPGACWKLTEILDQIIDLKIGEGMALYEARLPEILALCREIDGSLAAMLDGDHLEMAARTTLKRRIEI